MGAASRFSACFADLQTRATAAEAENERLWDLLRLVEWGGANMECPLCERYPKDGHADGCELGAAMRLRASRESR